MNAVLEPALTPEDLANALKMSKTSIYRKIRLGEIPAKKMGKEYRVSPTFLWYFKTGLDFDIYQMQQVDGAIMAEHSHELKAIRKQI